MEGLKYRGVVRIPAKEARLQGDDLHGPGFVNYICAGCRHFGLR